MYFCNWKMLRKFYHYVSACMALFALGCSSVVQLNMQPPLTVENTTVRAICTYGVPFHRHYPLIRINDTTYFYYRLGEGVLRNFAYTFDIDDTRKVTTFVIIHNHVKTWENGTTYQCYHLDENRLPVNSIIGILIVLKRVSVDNSVLSKVDDSLLTSFTSCFTSSISSNSVIAIRSKDVYSRFQSENNMTQSTLTFSLEVVIGSVAGGATGMLFIIFCIISSLGLIGFCRKGSRKAITKKTDSNEESTAHDFIQIEVNPAYEEISTNTNNKSN